MERFKDLALESEPRMLADNFERMDLYAMEISPLKSFIFRVKKVIVANEGTEGSLNPDDAGAGISVGVRQWNQKTGDLPELLKAWHDANPEKFSEIFGNFSGKLLDEQWVRTVNMHRQQGLISAMKKALLDPEYRQVQNELVQRFISKGARFAQENGFRTEFAVAAIIDAVNQCGFGAVERAFDALGVDRLRKKVGETALIDRLENYLARPNAQARLDKLRKSFSAQKVAPRVIYMNDLLPFSILV